MVSALPAGAPQPVQGRTAPAADLTGLKMLLRKTFLDGRQRIVDYILSTCEFKQVGATVVIKTDGALFCDILKSDRNRLKMLQTVRQRYPDLGLEIVAGKRLCEPARPGSLKSGARVVQSALFDETGENSPVRPAV